MLARKEVASLAGHADYVCSVVFSPDGQLIVSGSGDKLVKVWSVPPTVPMREAALTDGCAAGWTHETTVFSVAFSPDVQHIVSAAASGDDFGAGVVCLARSLGGCVADSRDTRIGFIDRLQSRWAAYCLGKWGQIGEGMVYVCSR